ncbi:hypothetical protein KC340_g15230 [Hortaea werneckii]|nr:hypothetical protein KC342_g15596 [Hortaea werneckii]KAI7063137.1 hypothetical protein KC339_g16356 [Hortaea werneckii]KAI7212743.1 hypothetical protein KC365_g14508 [Hortaea werneckii]KAI7296849.1 hypothetical protein KC340_g15230 [Hortaea werneckii]KAI7400049.1 hypothetical protein KC328_g3739 [Hortaea werneckii]
MELSKDAASDSNDHRHNSDALHDRSTPATDCSPLEPDMAITTDNEAERLAQDLDELTDVLTVKVNGVMAQKYDELQEKHHTLHQMGNGSPRIQATLQRASSALQTIQIKEAPVTKKRKRVDGDDAFEYRGRDEKYVRRPEKLIEPVPKFTKKTKKTLRKMATRLYKQFAKLQKIEEVAQEMHQCMGAIQSSVDKLCGPPKLADPESDNDAIDVASVAPLTHDQGGFSTRTTPLDDARDGELAVQEESAGDVGEDNDPVTATAQMEDALPEDYLEPVRELMAMKPSDGSSHPDPEAAEPQVVNRLAGAIVMLMVLYQDVTELAQYTIDLCSRDAYVSRLRFWIHPLSVLEDADAQVACGLLNYAETEIRAFDSTAADRLQEIIEGILQY